MRVVAVTVSLTFAASLVVGARMVAAAGLPDTDRAGRPTVQQVFCDPMPFGSALVSGVPADRRETPTGMTTGPARRTGGSTEGRQGGSEGGIAGGSVASFLSLDSDPEGDMPRAVAVTPNGQYAVVVNRDTDLMVFIDLATVQIVASVPIGDYPIDVAISGDGAYAISTNVFDNTVSVVSIATKSLVADIPVTGEQPFRVLCTADGSKAIVGVINDAIASSFSVLDLDTMSEIASFPSTPQGVIGFFFTPAFAIGGELTTSFDLTPDGSRIVLPWRGGSQVTFYDVASGVATTTLDVDSSPSMVDISDDGSRAVVIHDGSPSHVTVLDVPQEAVIAAHSVTSTLDPFVGRITPNKQHAMAASLNSVVFVHLGTGAIDSTLTTGTVGDIEFSADRLWAFVSNFNASVINLSTRTIVSTISFGACVDAAASPTTNVVVALNNRFREEVYAYNLNGASSNFKGFTRSGPAPERDAPNQIAIAPNGTTALVANSVSRNVSLVNLATETVAATIDTGDVPRESAFTPNGQFALVCNGDSNTVSVIDVALGQVVKTLNTPQRPTRVRISPDGTKAYVCTVAGIDTLYFIALNGASSSIQSSFPIGSMGAANGYSYSEVSGMELSPDGKYLAFAISFEDVLRIVNTQTQTIVANVPTGDFPIRVTFSPDGSRIFVADSFGDDVLVVESDNGTFTPVGSAGGIDFPLDMALDADGQHLYVGRNSFQTPAVDVVDLNSFTVVRSVLLPGLPREGEYLADRDEYIVSTDDGSLVRIEAAGKNAAIIETIATSGSAPDMRFSPQLNLAVASWPGIPDGLDLIHFGGTGMFGDLDGDGAVGPADLAILLGNWGAVGGSADLDGDGGVGPGDLALLLGAWTSIG